MITIYSIKNCVWCYKAKLALETAGIGHICIDVEDDDKKVVSDEMGWPSYPIIYKEEDGMSVLIGGFDQLINEIVSMKI